MSKNVTMHYSGKMKIVGKRSTELILPGWAACCSGEKTEAIRRQGNTTRDKDEVTCRACRKKIAAEISGWEEYPESFSGGSHWDQMYHAAKIAEAVRE